jgi:hypothetical protein
METQQMTMPAGMAAPGPGPEEMAIFDRMRQEISPQEFTNEMLASGSQVDPQAVAEFTQALDGLDMPPEVLDALNDMVDGILAEPENYPQMRQEFIKEGVPEDFLPEQFDPQFFAALNMAVDQMVAAPTGVQAFAQGGIAELKPIAQAIASYGRNGDTMLAHITPAEARMLRRRGGSGTTNPDTGLPEFFNLFKAIGKVFKGVGDAISGVVKGVASAVKKFASSTVGKIITTVALGFFLGPEAARFLRVGSAAGVAAVSGFVGSAGSTLLGGGNLRDALKAGAIGGLTAGAGAGVMGGADAFASGSYTGPTTVGGQVDAFKGMLPGSAPVVDAPAPVVDAPAAVPGLSPSGMAPVPDADPLGSFIQQNDAARAAANTPAASPQVATGAPSAYKTPTIGESLSKMGQGLGMGEGPASFDTFKQGATDLFAPGGPSTAQIDARAAEMMDKNPRLPWGEASKRAAAELAPGMLRTYGPAAAAGLGIMGLSGGFQTKQPAPSEMARGLRERDARFPTLEQKPSDYYVQGLPGVKYDERGAIIGSQPWSPKATMDDIRVGSPTRQGGLDSLGDMGSVYNVPSGAIGQSRSIYQPYNTAAMYPNLYAPSSPMRTYADGGEIQQTMSGIATLAQGGYPRRTGQISGPGTEKSDSIPAMLSDGEFVMTAKAVKGAGNGSRRSGAKKMYALMHQLERNASRG